MNTVTVVGNMTAAPELRVTPNGQAVAAFRVAVNRRWMDRTTQEWQEQVSFFDVSVWGDLAENVAGSLGKGTRVVVVGRLEQRSWEKDGEKHYRVQIVAEDVAPSLRFAECVVSKNEPKAAAEPVPASSGRRK